MGKTYAYKERGRTGRRPYKASPALKVKRMSEKREPRSEERHESPAMERQESVAQNRADMKPQGAKRKRPF